MSISRTILYCKVCGFQYSDLHHIYPQSKGGKNTPTIALCPNHHRLAHMVQEMVFKGFSLSSIETTLRSFTDDAFLAIVPDLCQSQIETEKLVKLQCEPIVDEEDTCNYD